MVREVILFPDPMLKTRCEPVESFGEDLEALARDLRDTLAASPGCVGLAAPQIGIPLRVVLVDVRSRFPERLPLLLVNPVIEEASRWKIVREGCQSIPDFLANVRRADKVRARAFDEHGTPIEIESRNLEAIAVQHEVDHLEGILFLDRVASVKTDVFRRVQRGPTGPTGLAGPSPKSEPPPD